MVDQTQLSRADAEILSEVMKPLLRIANTVPPEKQPDALEHVCAIRQAQIVRRYR